MELNLLNFYAYNKKLLSISKFYKSGKLVFIKAFRFVNEFWSKKKTFKFGALIKAMVSMLSKLQNDKLKLVNFEKLICAIKFKCL